MTLQLLPSEFPYTVYEENLTFFFISADKQCAENRKKWVKSERGLSVTLQFRTA
jgi:hypothetical protein